MKNVGVLFLLFSLSANSADIKLERAKGLVKDGFWFYNKGDFKAAMSCYKKALELKPDFPDAWYWYGDSLFRYGMIDIAKVCYEKYLKLCDDPYVKNKLERYWEKGKDGYSPLFTIKGDVKDTSRFISPCGIYIDRFDNLYVAGFGNDVIIKFSPFGKEILRIKDKALKKPYGVCVDKDGNIYATSKEHNCVLKFSPSGKLLLRFGKKGIKNGEFIGLKGIEVDSFGYIYVVDTTRMQKFSPKGKFIGKIDNLTFANNLSLDNKHIFISEKGSIKKFDLSFNYISSLAINGKWVFLYNNNLYISTDNYIFIYSKDLKPIKKIALDFTPYSLALNRFGFLYVSSPSSSEIHTFSNTSNRIRLIVNRIDLGNYPMVLFGLTIKADDKDIGGLSLNNFRVLEENRAVYPLGVDKDREHIGLIFVIENSKYINKKAIKGLLFSLVKQFKDGFGGASIISFSNTSNVLSDFTLNKTQIRDAIEFLSFKEDVTEDSFLSSLNKGITSAISLLSKKAIIVITSVRCKEETEEIKRLGYYARNNGIPIFIIDYKKDRDKILEKLSEVSDGKYLLARNSKELNNFYNFLKDELSYQRQYILYYHSPNAAFKWSNEWISAELEIGQGRFGLCSKISYLIPPFGGAKSSLARTLIENKLYALEAEKIRIKEKEKEKIRKEIKEAQKAKEKKEGEKSGGH